MPSALIIGAGISGLVTAYSLKKAGWSIRLLEEGKRPGGAIKSKIEAGFLNEAGPNSFMVTSPEQDKLIHELGLGNSLLTPSSEANKRYLVRNGCMIAAPTGPFSALTTPLFSFKSKLGILREPWIKKPEDLAEESLASFVRRRLGDEFLDYAINPFVGGIYAGNPEELSVQHGFPKLAALEASYGSLIRGTFAKLKEKRTAKKRGEPVFKSYMVSFKEGLQSLPDALARQLGKQLRLQAKLITLSEGTRWHASWDTPTGEDSGDFEHVIFALPAHRLNQLPLSEGLRQSLSSLGLIQHPPVTSLFLGYKREQVKAPLDGFGVLIPEVEKLNALGVLFSSTLFPGRAPEGHVALTVFVGGTRGPEIAGMTAGKILQKIQPELKQLLGVEGEPVEVRSTQWKKAIPQYTLGYQRFYDRIAKAETEHPGLHLVGNYRNGIALGKCIDNALALGNTLSG